MHNKTSTFCLGGFFNLLFLSQKFVKLFVLLQHFDKLLDTLRTCLCLLRGLNSEQERISLRALQCSKEVFGFLMPIQGGLEIFRDGNIFLRSIRRVPAPMFLCSSNRLQSC